jgi:hypothetical protein
MNAIASPAANAVNAARQTAAPVTAMAATRASANGTATPTMEAMALASPIENETTAPTADRRSTAAPARAASSLWPRLLLASVTCCLALLSWPAAAQDNSAAALTKSHAALRAQLEASALGVPVIVSSVETGDQTRGEVHALINQPFDTLAAHLSTPRDWCRVVLLHLNIKACTHERVAGKDMLTVYSGRKVYESPEKAFPLRFVFGAANSGADHLDVELNAADGPLGTTDYRITLGAIAVPQGSFVRFAYAYRSSTLSRLAINSYLATLGRGKLGFTIIGTGPDAKPEYVQGRRGIVERNAVRYYFAIQAFLEGLASPPAQRFEHDLERWFELTERFPLQLHELERDDYLSGKRRELEQQNKRQQALDAAATERRPEPVRQGG